MGGGCIWLFDCLNDKIWNKHYYGLDIVIQYGHNNSIYQATYCNSVSSCCRSLRFGAFPTTVIPAGESI